MADAFPVRFPNQLRQHLRALRKRHGLTQAQLGALIGVSQARIAEIEANPGLVNFEQLMKLLSVLGVSLTLQEAAAAPAATRAPEAKASRRTLAARPRKGSW
ncbi:MAG: helix-turn-helix transcriptional regulator [Piscinibacter sp.]|uniref:helix-turn-helix domain-containing protein n=1 Tax=Piscinibacter sp. TaxID=1903157 RepID=UPI0011D7B66D|nr:helix-turn-helix domain-containing protein [Piscinibacter sp.]MBP5989426.1 helix-turn-helix transcriptional regulator [Piscinibacter sp.]MBP6027313.1 helix-turn-helix transcriptional regulator [Piscinibacter sp.]TXH47532.1 MAG: transcriptional regulator [Burkholderiaceae bacterium]